MLQFLKKAAVARIDLHIIRNNLGAKSAECQSVDEGRPTVPYQGLVFFGLHNGHRVNVTPGGPESYWIKERHDFSVTISLKTSQRPRYKVGDSDIDNAEDAMHALEDLVIGLFHQKYDLATEANLLIADSNQSNRGSYIAGEEMVWDSSGSIEPRSGDWFGSKLDSKGGFAGLSLQVNFRGPTLMRTVGQIAPSAGSTT